MMHLEIGKKYLTRDGRETVVKYIDTYGIATTHWGSKVWADSGEVIRDKKSDGDLVSLARDLPVREVTRREIVPGTYGRVIIDDPCGDSVVVALGTIDPNYVTMTAEELREAAHILNQIAEAME